LKAGLSGALWELGGVPSQLQTDQSSTATHPLRRGSRERGFNPEYLAFCAHFGVEGDADGGSGFVLCHREPSFTLTH
jgi:hypothetical protein